MNTLRPVRPSSESRSMKNTRRPSLEVWNCPGATRDRSERRSKRSFSSAARWLTQGQTNSASAAITTSTGQLVRSTGRTKRLRPTPLANQIVISLSRYMRPSVATTEMNSDSASIVEQVAERGIAQQQHDVLRRHASYRGLAERADQHHRQHDGQDDDQRRTEAARQIGAQGGIE